MITIYINGKPCMESPMTPSHLTLSDLERSKSRSLRFRSLISCKGAELGHILLLHNNRKTYIVSLMTSHLKFEFFIFNNFFQKFQIHHC